MRLVLFFLAACGLLAGCARHFFDVCSGPPPSGRYELRLEAVGDVPMNAPTTVYLVVDPAESIGPITCGVFGEERDACGASTRIRCELLTHTRTVIGTFDADLDLAWTADGAEGGATVTWRDAAGRELGPASYDATIVPE